MARPRHTPRGRRWPLSVAPMVDRTDRHLRRLLRHITRHTLLYTEMTPALALLRGDAGRLLDHDPEERPLALQLAGDDPASLAAAARLGAAAGYTEINLNVGCPSPRVQRGRFGACLMANPELVAACVGAVRAAVPLPVTVKHRIGLAGRQRYEDLRGFVDRVAEAGCDRFIVHARIAVLEGLDPHQNRTVPPLRPGEVRRLKRERPWLRVEINGGYRTLADARRELPLLDGVMVGRAACDDPYRLLALADQTLFGDPRPAATRREVLSGAMAQLERMRRAGQRPHLLLRHLGGLVAGQPGARGFRRALGEGAARPGAGPQTLRDAMRQLSPAVLDARPGAPPPSAGTPTASAQRTAPLSIS